MALLAVSKDMEVCADQGICFALPKILMHDGARSSIHISMFSYFTSNHHHHSPQMSRASEVALPSQPIQNTQKMNA